MNKLTSYIVGSVIAAIVVAVLAFVGARNLLGSGGQEPERGVDAPASASAQVGEGDVVKRPACPEGAVAGV
ncbi:TlpA family protein disulfide reductase, partial [Corynebacterium striatum]